MKNIFFRDGILIYYGNPAGYLSEGKVVLDSIFDKEEIIAFLSEKEKLAVEIRSGVYDRLSEGGGMEMTVEASKGRRIRIYQIKQDSPFMMRFISLAEREKRGFEKPQQKEYALVYEGEVDTFSLEDVWEKFGRRVPRDFIPLCIYYHAGTEKQQGCAFHAGALQGKCRGSLQKRTGYCVCGYALQQL